MKLVHDDYDKGDDDNDGDNNNTPQSGKRKATQVFHSSYTAYRELCFPYLQDIHMSLVREPLLYGLHIDNSFKRFAHSDSSMNKAEHYLLIKSHSDGPLFDHQVINLTNRQNTCRVFLLLTSLVSANLGKDTSVP